MTVLFAFLVTPYLAADKLSALIAYIVLGLFSLIAVGMIMEIWIIDHDARSSGSTDSSDPVDSVDVGPRSSPKSWVSSSTR